MANPVGIISSAVSAGVSIYQLIQANKDKKEAKAEWDEYMLEDISNPYAGLDRVPMEAYNLRHEANATQLATGMSLAQQSGRGLSIAGKMTDQYARNERELYGDVEQYKARRDMQVASGESEKQRLELAREQRYLEGLSGFYGAADASSNNAMVSLGSSVSSMGDELLDYDWKG